MAAFPRTFSGVDKAAAVFVVMRESCSNLSRCGVLHPTHRSTAMAEAETVVIPQQNWPRSVRYGSIFTSTTDGCIACDSHLNQRRGTSGRGPQTKYKNISPELRVMM